MHVHKKQVEMLPTWWYNDAQLRTEMVTKLTYDMQCKKLLHVCQRRKGNLQERLNWAYNWLVNTDGNGATVRVVLLDFPKAFDLIDHSVLVKKLTAYDIPSQVKSWIVDFLMDRKQRVKLAQDCHSEWRSVPSGVPEGTKLGPW